MKLKDFSKVIINYLYLLKYGLNHKERQIFLDMLKLKYFGQFFGFVPSFYTVLKVTLSECGH